MSDERDAERYYEEQAERAAYEDHVAAKNAEDWRAMEAELTALRRVAEAARHLEEDLDGFLREVDAPKGGMRVPYFGPLAASVGRPSVVSWARGVHRRLRDALTALHSKEGA